MPNALKRVSMKSWELHTDASRVFALSVRNREAHQAVPGQLRTVAALTEHSLSCHSRVAVGYASDKRNISILTASLELHWVLLGKCQFGVVPI